MNAKARTDILPALDALLDAQATPLMVFSLLIEPYRLGDHAVLDRAVARLCELRQHPHLTHFFEACARISAGEALAALNALDALSGRPASSPELGSQTGPVAASIRAAALEKLGRYEDAYAAFSAMNAMRLGRTPTPFADYRKSVLAQTRAPLAPLPPANRPGYFQMLGFARSGTTLLENALDAHPQIETFEEVGALNRAREQLEMEKPRTADPERMRAAMSAARDRYYQELDGHRRKRAAGIFVDKMPPRSAEARFLIRMFPEQRYIFQIRHPFDVALSCFRQLFQSNPVTDQFRTFQSTVAAYDFAMTEWFALFGLDHPLVHYVRYEELVSSFEPTMRQTLSFLGAAWDPAVLTFVDHAKQRAGKTPSYSKLRQGLQIGVQSNWFHYRFLFETREAEPLHRWAAFFRYPTVM